MTKIYIITEEYGSPWTGHVTIVHDKAYLTEEEANAYSLGDNAQCDGILDVQEVEVNMKHPSDDINVKAFNNSHL